VSFELIFGKAAVHGSANVVTIADSSSYGLFDLPGLCPP